jgi:hypothetical protein
MEYVFKYKKTFNVNITLLIMNTGKINNDIELI